MNQLWTDLALRIGLTLSQEQNEKLERYLELLIEANQRVNLTRITDLDAARVQHIGDALTLLPFLPRTAHRLADVGSGGGVPGIPLAIVRPDAAVTLIESTKKKAEILKDLATRLDLPNVTVLPDRAEDAGQSNLRETFDIVTARAVATLDWLGEWCLPLVKKGGKMLAMKGPRATEELLTARKIFRILGGGEAIVHPVELPGTTALVIIEVPKIGRTDVKYPRGATIAKGKAMGADRKRL